MQEHDDMTKATLGPPKTRLGGQLVCARCGWEIIKWDVAKQEGATTYAPVCRRCGHVGVVDKGVPKV